MPGSMLGYVYAHLRHQMSNSFEVNLVIPFLGPSRKGYNYLDKPGQHQHFLSSVTHISFPYCPSLSLGAALGPESWLLKSSLQRPKVQLINFREICSRTQAVQDPSPSCPVSITSKYF